MENGKMKSVAYLLAGIGILLIGIAAMIFALRPKPRPPWSVPFTSGSTTCIPTTSTKECTRKITDDEMERIVSEMKGKKLNIPIDPDEIADAAFKELSGNKLFKESGADPEMVRESIKKVFTNPEVTKALSTLPSEEDLRRAFKDAPVHVIREEVRRIK